ncbi:ShTK domain protein [Trichostrongylus colubriformis]|uniref:ShTK domain protein n=1 Tax=Trichostrongylus colubriformis TaxID=6319 RepID=A0AAN8IPV4_TRICO
MLFYVLIAFIALNAFTQEGVMAQVCQDMGTLCESSFKKYCDDTSSLGETVKNMCQKTCGVCQVQE